MRPAGPRRGYAKALLLAAFCGLYILHVAGAGAWLQLRQWQTGRGGQAPPRRRLREQVVEESDLAAEGAAGPSGAEVAAALAAEAAARGYTPKAGPTRLHYWTAANRTARHEQFTRWVDETTEHPDSGLAADTSGDVRLPRLQPVYPNCQVLVNHRYKFIYLRHPKSASSSVTMYFTLCPPKQLQGPARPQATAGAAAADSGGAAAEAAAAEGSSSGGGAGASGGDAAAAAAAQARRRGLLAEDGQGAGGAEAPPLGRGAACLEPLTTSELPPEELGRIWREYFVFTTVRNPFQRMLSSYKYLLRKTRANPNCRMVRWDDFCQDPLALGRVCLQDPACCPLAAGFYFHHVIDQGRCLETEDGGWATDYVATVESFEEDMREIIAEIDRRRPPGLPPLAAVAAELTHQNEARGAGAKQACSMPEDLDALVPERTKVLTPTRGWVAYNATVLLDRHCDPADYFRGRHRNCFLQARHFYATDFRRLYGLEPPAPPGRGPQQWGQQEQPAPSGAERERPAQRGVWQGEQKLGQPLRAAE